MIEKIRILSSGINLYNKYLIDESRNGILDESDNNVINNDVESDFLEESMIEIIKIRNSNFETKRIIISLQTRQKIKNSPFEAVLIKNSTIIRQEVYNV